MLKSRYVFYISELDFGAHTFRSLFYVVFYVCFFFK